MNKLKTFSILLSTILILSGCGVSTPELGADSQNSSDKTNTAIKQQFSYEKYADVLKKYVDDKGLVNYQGLKADRQKLDEFAAAIGAVHPETYSSWSETEKLTFLINAYNALTLQLIINQDPIPDSIRDIFNPWKGPKFPVVGEEISLDEIEHGIIRKKFDEPRIHVALVCAAISCPILLNEPYYPDQLDAQLDKQSKAFAESPQGFSLDRNNKQVRLSSIYKWYGQDWEKAYGVESNKFTGKFSGNNSEKAVLNFISEYLPAEQKEYLKEGNYRVNYLDYDWSLNKQ